jgi:hypothetical protein
MPANTQPIFSIQGETQWVTATDANNVGNITGGTIYLAFTAGTNGSYVQKIRFRHTGANAAAVVARVFINNGSATGTAANNTLFDEITIAANATFTTNAASINYELPLGFALPPNYRLYVALGAAASGGIACTVIGGDY